MEELSIEQKAKAYDEALKRMKSWARGEHPECFTEAQKAAEFIFPELKEESEDERIRKEMIDFFKGFYDNLNVKAVDVEPWIAWLEKQGEHTNKVEPNFKVEDKIQFLRKCGTIMTIEKIENGEYIFKDNMGHVSIEEGNKWHLVEEQKPADKVEPKFHQGEWITNGDYTWKIIEVKPLDYILQSQDGNIVDDTISHVDEQFHSFTIEDAKDGDVLACGNDIVIFKENSYNPKDQSGCMFVYCAFNKCGYWYEIGGINPTCYKPATKEQRNTLMKAMVDARYEWDAEKKELKKVEQKAAENEELTEFDKAVGVIIGTWNPKTPEQIQSVKAVSKKLLKLAKKQINDEQKVAWSEEDEKKIDSIIETIRIRKFEHPQIAPVYEGDIDWLKSLKDRVILPSKQECSEEIEIEIWEKAKKVFPDSGNMQSGFVSGYKEAINSLRPQPKQEWSWSEEDLVRIENCISLIGKTGDGEVKWLKDLKDRVQPQPQWKPSEEHMTALRRMKAAIAGEGEIYKPLNSLYEDLKKLREE